MSRRSTRSLAKAPPPVHALRALSKIDYASGIVVTIELQAVVRQRAAFNLWLGHCGASSKPGDDVNKTGALSEHDRGTSRSLDREGGARRPQATLAKGMSPLGPSRHFVVTQQFSRFRSEADIPRAALTEPDL
jgi:hypothetical protein